MYAPKTLNDYFTAVDDFFKKTFRDDSELFLSVKTRQHLLSASPKPHTNVNDLSKRNNLQNTQSHNTELQYDATSSSTAPITTQQVPQPIASPPPSPTTTTTTMYESGQRTMSNDNVVFANNNPLYVTNSDNYAQHNYFTPSRGSNTSSEHSYIAFSPRMWYNRDGSVFGKVKMYFTFPFRWIGVIENGLMLDSRGVITTVGKVREMIEGLVLAVRYSVNTIAPASEDVVTTKLDYRHNDFYSTIGYQRNYLGSSNLLVDVGSLFLNMLVGAGFERQQLSYLEQKDEIPQVDVMYGGLGYSGENWTVAAKLTRTREAWSALRVALLQRLTPSTMLSWSYNLNMALSTTHAAVGFSQRFTLRLPSFISTSASAPYTDTTMMGGMHHARDSASANQLVHEIPFIGACKAESNGLCSLTVRGVLSECVWYGVVLQKNFSDRANNKVRCGLVINMDASS